MVLSTVSDGEREGIAKGASTELLFQNLTTPQQLKRGLCHPKIEPKHFVDIFQLLLLYPWYTTCIQPQLTARPQN